MRIKSPIRKKRVTFLRRNSNKKTFNKKWRSPKGIHNKRRLHKQGHQKRPVIGFGSPKELKYLTKEGLLPIIISNIKDLKEMDKIKEVALLSKKLGIKKKIILVEEAKKLGIEIANVDMENFAEEVKKELQEKKKETKKREEKKKKSQKESLKKAEEKQKEEKKETKKTDEEIKEETKEKQKEEIDLIKKEKPKKSFDQAPKKQSRELGRITEMIPEGNKQ